MANTIEDIYNTVAAAGEVVAGNLKNTADTVISFLKEKSDYIGKRNIRCI